MDQDAPPDFEIEHGHDAYTTEELLEHAQANAQLAIMATAAFFDEQGVSLDAWTRAIGRVFARGWGEPRPWDAGEFLDAILTNIRAIGGEVVSVVLQSEHAEAVTVGFPDPDLCAQFGVDIALAARYNDAIAPIAAERGLSWVWTLEDDQTRYLVGRASA